MNLPDMVEDLWAERQRRGWTLRQLEARCGFCASALAYCERGEHLPTTPMLAAWGEALGFKFGWVERP